MVRKKGIIKNALREISLNKKKFISLLLIIVMGISFYVGLKETPSIMRKSAETYYEEINLFDLKIVSSIGFSKSDKILLKEIKGVKGVSLSKTLDVMAIINNNDYNINISSISENRNLKSDDYINHLILVKGRYPSTINEGLVEEKFLTDNNLSIGDLVTLKPESKDDLKAKKIKIVGVVKNNLYSSRSINTNNRKKKKIDYFMYLEENDFTTEYYNEGFITLNNIDKHKDEIDKIISESTNLSSQRKIEALTYEIESLKDDLNCLNQTDLPSESLSDSIKQVSNNLEKKEKELSKVKKIYAYSIKQAEIPNIYEYKLETERLENIAKSFPLMFLLLAATITSLIIASMIDKDKKEIGMLKTIGYSNISIMFKYILYAFLIIFTGSILSLVLYKILPLLILYYYNKAYNMPIITTKLNVNLIYFATLIFFLLTILSCTIAFLRITKKTPAKLMRPETSKKTLLEKNSKIWSKLSNKNKILIKNIFASKKKLIMLIVIVTGSSALILTSFGIKDSVMSSIDNQFKKINKYDMSIQINSEIKEDEKDVLQNQILNNNKIKKITYVAKSNISLKNKNNIENAYLIIPSNERKINDFIALKEKKRINLNDKGIVISKKLAKILKVKKNDKIKITLPNDKKIDVKITNITENYIEHYVYMSPTFYEKITKEKPNFTNILVINKKINKKDEQALKNKIYNLNNIINVELTSDIKENHKEMMDALNSVIMILVCFIVTLTLIILNNLTSTNISERKDEITTKKALGFYNTEVNNYINKETNIIAVISIILGLITGSFLTYFVNKTCETNSFLFSFNINILSYIFTFIIIIILLFIINLITYFKVKKITNSKNV